MFAMGWVLFFSYPKTFAKRLLFILCFEAFFWQIVWFASFFLATPNLISLFAKIAYITITFLPFTLFHFVVVFLKLKNTKVPVRFFYSIALCLICLLPTDFFIGGYRKFYWGNFAKPGPLYFIYVLTALIAIIWGIALLFSYYKNQKDANLESKQVGCVLAGLILYSSCALDFFPVYGTSWYPIGAFSFLGSFMIIAYGILKHQLLDIQVIVRRTLVFAGLLAFVFGIYTFATLFIRNVVSGIFVINEFWSNALAIGLIVVGYDPLRKFLMDLTDKYLFQKGYNYHQVLKDASRGMAKIESLKHLLGLVLHFVTMKMRVEAAAVLSHDSNERLFRLVAARGYKGNVMRVSLNGDHPLLEMLQKKRDAIQLHEITELLESDTAGAEKRGVKIISDEMKMLGAKCAIPSFLGKDLKNVLLIGDKKSGEPLTTEDISLLMTLAQESSIAIENARLYDEAIKKQKQLGQINDQLEHSKKMLVNALSEAEGANKQLQDTQAQLIHEQKMATLGRLAASVGHEVNNPLTILSMNVSRAILKFRKNPELKVSEILDVFDKMEKNIERIKAVVNTLTGLLKKSEKGKFEPLSLKLILEETLPLVQFQTYMDNLSGTEVELNVPGSVPLIRGDLERLQEIFLNLFINAYHAMANKRFRKIRVDAELDQETAGMVAIHFTDNGSGMSEDTMKKVFNYGYTTKPPGKGSGLGLYMCKYIVELHGGTIRVKSKMGEGTTFTVTLPVYQEEQTAASASQQKAG